MGQWPGVGMADVGRQVCVFRGGVSHPQDPRIHIWVHVGQWLRRLLWHPAWDTGVRRPPRRVHQCIIPPPHSGRAGDVDGVLMPATETRACCRGVHACANARDGCVSRAAA